MAIKFLRGKDGYSAGAVVATLSARQEAAYVASLDATYDVDNFFSPTLLTDTNGKAVGISGTDGALSLLTGRNEILQRPWRFASFGDSRANVMSNSALSVTGSTTYLNEQRGALAIAGAFDCEFVANFGVSGDTAGGWAAAARTGAKTINNLLSGSGFPGGPVDACWIQYGINDFMSGSTAISISGALRALCSALMGAGIKVLFESTLPVSAANYGANAAAKLQATLDSNAIMRDWLAMFPGEAVYVDTASAMVDATGYASTVYFSDGTHLNRLGGLVCGRLTSAAVRSILPRKLGLAFTTGSLLRPNLIDWAAPPTMIVAADQGTFTFSTPVFGLDDTLGPYAEVVATVLTLNAGRALARFQCHATTIAGATPRYALAVGDVLQGSAFVVVDDGADGVPPVQAVMLRQRAYFDSKFADVGAFAGAAAPTFVAPFAFRMTTPTFAIATGSGAIAAPGGGAGYPLECLTEYNTVGQTARIRLYCPTLRVVSQAQPTQPTIGASPATFTNTTGSAINLIVAGGTVSALTLSRNGGTALTTGFTSSAGVGNITIPLAQNDAVTITYTVAPTLTVVPDEQKVA